MKIEKQSRTSRSRRAEAGGSTGGTLPQRPSGTAPDRTCFVCGHPIAGSATSWAARAGAGLCSGRPVVEVCSARCEDDPRWCAPTTCLAGW